MLYFEVLLIFKKCWAVTQRATCWLFFEDIVNLKYFNGTEPRYVPLPKVVKSGFILVQTNADTEQSLSVNDPHCDTGNDTSWRDRPRSVKDAVKFYDPENLRPEKIALTDGPITAVWSADMHHKKRLGEEEAEKKRKEAEEKLKAEEVDWSKRDQAALSLGSKVYS